MPEDKLGNLLLSLVIPFAGEQQDRAGREAMEEEKTRGGGGGGRGRGDESQKSAVISHETKAHSAQIWLVSHLEPSLPAFKAHSSARAATAALSS